MPVRQWALTRPYRLRYRLAWDHTLFRAVLGVYARTLLASTRARREDSASLTARPAPSRRGRRYLVRAFLAHLNLAPGPDIPGPVPSPTTPPPPRNLRQAAHRRCPITGSTQPPGPRSAHSRRP
jgi:hypothetical protein